MRHRTERHQDAAERTLKDMRRKTRLDEILDRQEDVDWLMPGPADLSTSLGVHGRVA